MFERNVSVSAVVLVLAALVVAAAAFALGGLVGGAVQVEGAVDHPVEPDDEVAQLRLQNEALRQEIDKMQQALEDAQSAEPFRETIPDMPEGMPDDMPQMPLVERPFLGIRYMPLEEGAQGAEVVIVDADSPAERKKLAGQLEVAHVHVNRRNHGAQRVDHQ